MKRNVIAVALGAALALPAVAQTEPQQQPGQPPSGSLGDRIRRSTGQPGARPAPAPGQAQAQGQGHQLTQEQRAAFGEVWARNSLAIRVGELASSRASSPEVQGLGRKLVEEHQHMASEFTSLLAQRGGDVNKLAAGPQLARLEPEITQLATKSGEEFDREFIAFLTRNHPGFVEDAKRARDVTAGKDSQLKKWLDEYENIEEAHLAEARQLKSKRQARTPPAR